MAKTKDFIVKLEDFTQEGKEINAYKKNAIRIDGLTTDAAIKADYKIVGNNLEITVDDKKLIVKNYGGIRYIKTNYKQISRNKYSYELYDLIGSSRIDNPEKITTYNARRLTANGTNYNDTFDFSASTYAPTGRNLRNNRGLTINGGNGNDTITGTKYNDTINGGAGNDIIYGTEGSDYISGGVGENTIVYTSFDQLGDTINLTKGENLKIDISKLNISPDKIKCEVQGKNLVVSIPDGENSKDFTIKNFGKYDVTNTATRRNGYKDTSSVKLVTSTNETIDLRTVAVNSSNGTWHNDYINRESYTNRRNRGLSLNGGAGDDTIIGSKYSDKIYGGNGDDTITGGAGNDTIVGGTGNNTLVFSEDFGNDTVYLTKGENSTLDFSSFNLDDISKLKFEYTNRNRDLKITVPNGKDQYGSVTLKNYTRTNVVGDKGSVNVKLSENNTVNLTDDDIFNFTKDNFAKNKKGTYVFTGSRLDETIDATGLIKTSINAGDGKNTVKLGAGDHDVVTGKDDDEIIVSSSNNTRDGGVRNIWAGAGHNKINIDNSGNFGDVTIYEQKVKAQNDIIFTNDIDKNYALQKNGNNLLVLKDAVTLVTVNDYFADNNSRKYRNKGTTEFYTTTGETTSKLDLNELANKVKEFVVTGSGTIRGTESANAIRANDVATTYKASNGKSYNIKASNDKIYAGKGNYKINAGRGNNNIYFYEGDGQDEILNGGGNDTINLMIDKKYNFDKTRTDIQTGNTMTITYGNNQEKSIVIALDNNDTLTISYGDSDKITVNNYTNSSVKHLKVGNRIYTLNFKIEKEPEKGSELEQNAGSAKNSNAIVNIPSPTDIPEGMSATPGGSYISGTSGDDKLIGTNKDDYIKGRGGNDVIYGGAGNDYLSGGDGDDQIYGGKGNDTLFGGGGHNTFYFASGDGFDTINEPGADNTLYFFGLNSPADLKFSIEQDTNGYRNLIISGYGSSYDNVVISQFIPQKNYSTDYSNYKLQTENQDTVSLYDAVMNSSDKDITPEIKQIISGFLSKGNNAGVDTQAITASNTITPEAILTTGTTTPQM